MKTRIVSFRVECGEWARWVKAAREKKNLTAFIVFAVRDHLKYRKAIAELERIMRRDLRLRQKAWRWGL